MRTLFITLSGITALAGVFNPWHLIFSGMFLIGFLLLSVASEKQKEKGHYRKVYWERREKYDREM